MPKLLGFAPDLSPDTDGAITACANIMPVARGMKAVPSPFSLGFPALAAPAQGAAIGVLLNGTYRVFAGTATKLYESQSGAWTDVSRSVGGAYSLGNDSRWRFAQFGDTTLATSKADVLQRSPTSGLFANVAGGAPKAALIETVGPFVMLANTNDATFGDSPNRWWCSAINNETSWTPNVATQATSGLLVDTPGAIIGLKQMGPDVVAYKERSIHIGRYVGGSTVWQWQRVPGDIGTYSQEAIVLVDTAHYFVGQDNFYLFDGGRPRPIGNPVWQWFQADLDKAYGYRMYGLHDRPNQVVFWFYPAGGSGGTINSCISYHYPSGKWGRHLQNIQCAVEILSGQITYDTLASYFATYSVMPSVGYDSPFWSSKSLLTSMFNSSNQLVALTGVAGVSSMTLNSFGSEDSFSMLQRIKPKFRVNPATASCSIYSSNTLGGAQTLRSTASYAYERFAFDSIGRIFQARVDMTGDAEMEGWTPSVVSEAED